MNYKIKTQNIKMEDLDKNYTFRISIFIPKKTIKEILTFFNIYFQQVIVFVKTDSIIFFNNEDETKISLFISLPYNNTSNTGNITPSIPYILEIKKILILTTNTQNENINMVFTDIGYGIYNSGKDFKYSYFTKNNDEKIRDFQIDNKIISEFNINDQFNTFYIYSKTEERINFKLQDNSIIFYFQNELEQNKLQYPLQYPISLIDDIYNNSYSIHILYLKFVSRINKLNKKNGTIKGNILCDNDQHYLSSIRIIFQNDEYEIKAYSKILHSGNTL